MEGVLKILNDATHTFIIENDQSCDMDNSFESLNDEEFHESIFLSLQKP